jgi:uncharacterized protein YggE
MNAACVLRGIWLAGLVWAATATVAPAQVSTAANDGITVSGTGQALARPNLVEVDLQVSGKAELTADALVKYRDAKQRVLDTLGQLKIDHMTTNDHALSINVGSSAEQQQQMINGMPAVGGKPQVVVSSTLRVTLTGVREIEPEQLIKSVGRLLDVAQDAGVNVGPTPAEVMQAYRFGRQLDNSVPVRFVLDDLAELREKAYENAVSDARDRATRLAKLHHVKLGPALSIQEIAVGGDAGGTTVVNAYIYQQTAAAPAPNTDGPRISSSSLAAVPVQVKLMVRFGIVPADPATAQK